MSALILHNCLELSSLNPDDESCKHSQNAWAFPNPPGGHSARCCPIRPPGKLKQREIHFDKTQSKTVLILVWMNIERCKPWQSLLLSGLWGLSKNNYFTLFDQHNKPQSHPRHAEGWGFWGDTRTLSIQALIPKLCLTAAVPVLHENCVTWATLLSCRGARNQGLKICTTQRPWGHPTDLSPFISNQKRISKGWDYNNTDCYYLVDRD